MSAGGREGAQHSGPSRRSRRSPEATGAPRAARVHPRVTPASGARHPRAPGTQGRPPRVPLGADRGNRARAPPGPAPPGLRRYASGGVKRGVPRGPQRAEGPGGGGGPGPTRPPRSLWAAQTRVPEQRPAPPRTPRPRRAGQGGQQSFTVGVPGVQLLPGGAEPSPPAPGAPAPSPAGGPGPPEPPGTPSRGLQPPGSARQRPRLLRRDREGEPAPRAAEAPAPAPRGGVTPHPTTGATAP